MNNDFQNQPESVVRESVTHKNLIIILLVGIVLVGGLLFVLVFNHQTVPVADTDVEPAISDSEVQSERRSLPVITNAPVVIESSTSTLDQTGTNPARYIPENEINTTPTDQSVAEPGTVTTGNDNTVQVKSVTVTNVAQTGTPETLTRSGVVRVIDFENNSFVIGDPGTDPYQINVTPETRFVINGQRIQYSQLNRDDIVEVVGEGNSNSVKLDADTVTVVGRYERVDRPVN